MIKRIIGGFGFIFIFYFCLLNTLLFLCLLSLFLIFGLVELFNIYTKSSEKSKVIMYGLIYISFVMSLAYLSLNNTAVIIYLTILLMLDDTFAYLVGMSIGKHKLSKISPNKTIEGSLGGIILAPIGAVTIMGIIIILLGDVSSPFFTFDFSTIENYNPFNRLDILIVVSIILAILGQIGDLVESYFKRSSNIKDSGKIIYGHGGILDRIDSWIFPTILMFILVLFI